MGFHLVMEFNEPLARMRVGFPVDSKVFDRILKALLPGKPLDVAAIATATGESNERVFVYLGELEKRSMVTYAEDPLGMYTITESGIAAALASLNITLELFQEKIGQSDPITEGVMLERQRGVGEPATRATFACGCLAYRLHPAAAHPGVLVAPCEAHKDAIANG